MQVLMLAVKELLSIVSKHLKSWLTVLTIIFRNMKILNVEIFGSTILLSKMSTHATLILDCLIKKESLIELCCDYTLQSRFKKESLSQFWISLENEYLCLTQKAIELLMVFSTSYLCEKSFSSLTLIETKQRNRLDAEAQLRVSETSLMPRLDCILTAKQQQISR